jgi:hypothetical protein
MPARADLFSMTRFVRRGQPALALFGMGSLALAYGSIVTLPEAGRWPGQIVVSIVAGAALVLAGAGSFTELLARQPDVADLAFTTPPILGARVSRACDRFGRGALRDLPALRWALLALFAGAALLAVCILASEAWAALTLAWAVPRGGQPIVLG